jgi:hypothetical protein
MAPDGGPTQLALALAADVLDDRAHDVYQDLKFKLVSRLPKEGSVLTENQLRSAIESIEETRGRPR